MDLTDSRGPYQTEYGSIGSLLAADCDDADVVVRERARLEKCAGDVEVWTYLAVRAVEDLESRQETNNSHVSSQQC